MAKKFRRAKDVVEENKNDIDEKTDVEENKIESNNEETIEKTKTKEKEMSGKNYFYKASYQLTNTNKKKYPRGVLNNFWDKMFTIDSKKEFYGEINKKIEGLHEISKDAFEKAEKFNK